MRWSVLERQFLVYRGGGGQSGSTTVNQLYSPEEAARRATVMGEAERIYGAVGPGQAPAGASADTLAAQERLRQYSTGTSQQMANQLVGAQQFGLQDVLNPGANPYYQAHQQAAIRPLTEAYTGPGGTQERIRSHFGDQPGVGTRESIAMGQAEKGYLNAVGDVTAKMGSQAYGQGLDVFGRTLALSPQTMQAGMMPALAQEAVGQQGEAYAEQQRQWGLNAPWMNLQNYANVVYGGAAPGTQTTGTAPGMTGTQRAGMVLSGATMGAMMGGGAPGAAIGAGAGLLLSMMA